jgi:hypothetical protein
MELQQNILLKAHSNSSSSRHSNRQSSSFKWHQPSSVLYQCYNTDRYIVSPPPAVYMRSKFPFSPVQGNGQNLRVNGLCPPSGILKRNVSETGSVPVLR